MLQNALQSATDALKTAWKKVIQKTAEGDLIGNKIADYKSEITRASKISSKNSSEINEEEIPREKYISAELRQKIIGDLGLKEEN